MGQLLHFQWSTRAWMEELLGQSQPVDRFTWSLFIASLLCLWRRFSRRGCHRLSWAIDELKLPQHQDPIWVFSCRPNFGQHSFIIFFRSCAHTFSFFFGIR